MSEPAGEFVGYGADDRWAHRRAEPRALAFLWTVYLFIATFLLLMKVGATGAISPDAYRPGARMLLMWVAAGIAVLWPLVRLSQRPAPDPIAAAVKDFLVILVPVQAVIWPQWWLAGWSVSAVAAIAAALAAWGSVSAAAIALALPGEPGPGTGQRSGWMAAFVLSAVGAPLVGLSTGRLLWGAGQIPPAVRPLWMFSPITAVYEICRDRFALGASAMATPAHWRAIGVVAAVSGVIWIAAAVRGSGRAVRTGLH